MSFGISNVTDLGSFLMFQRNGFISVLMTNCLPKQIPDDEMPCFKLHGESTDF